MEQKQIQNINLFPRKNLLRRRLDKNDQSDQNNQKDKKKAKITKMTRMGGAMKCPGNEVDYIREDTNATEFNFHLKCGLQYF